MKPKWSLSIFVLMILFILTLTACSNTPATPTEPIPTPTSAVLELVDGLGRTITFEQPAAKIVSIAPSNTEILFAIGAGSQVVGRDEFSDFPELAKAIPSVGGGFGVLDTETLVALAPDLVLASELTPAEQIQAIEQLGLKVYLLPNPQDIEGMLDNLLTVGKISGRSDEAQKLVDELKARIAVVDDSLRDLENRPLVFYELDSTDQNAPWTAGPGSFIDTLITRAGGDNLGAKLAEAYAQVSIEQLLLENPDVIIVGDYTWGGVTEEDVLARSSWSELSAVQQKRVYVFDDNLVSRPGPRMVEGLETMARLLHPELSK